MGYIFAGQLIPCDLFFLLMFYSTRLNFLSFGLVLIGGYVSNGGPAQGSQSEGDSTNTTVSSRVLPCGFNF